MTRLYKDDLFKIALSYPHINVSYYINCIKDFDGRKVFKNDWQYRTNTNFLGFLKETVGFGIEIANESFTPVHSFYQPWCWDYNEKMDAVENPWVLRFGGCDDISYFTRFKTIEDLNTKWENLSYLGSTCGLDVVN